MNSKETASRGTYPFENPSFIIARPSEALALCKLLINPAELRLINGNKAVFLFSREKRNEHIRKAHYALQTTSTG